VLDDQGDACCTLAELELTLGIVEDVQGDHALRSFSRMRRTT
jgi:hypothetical protein